MAPVIRVIGSLNVDLVTVAPRFPGPGETLTASSYSVGPGGKGANQAVACGRLSRHRQNAGQESSVVVEMVGAVGALDSQFDQLLKTSLETAGVDVSRVRTVKDAYTGIAVIIVDVSDTGENRILLSPGANYQGMQPTADVVGVGLASPIPDVIVFQSEIPVKTTISILRDIGEYKAKNRALGKKGIECGPDIIFNPAPVPTEDLPTDIYKAVDHLIMNETEGVLMAKRADDPSKEQIAEIFHQLGVASVVITLGSKGVWCSHSAFNGDSSGARISEAPRSVEHIPACKVKKVIDTTAAGDTFVGAYAVEVARWREGSRNSEKTGHDNQWHTRISMAINIANKAAARTVERPGAMDSIPWEDEI